MRIGLIGCGGIASHMHVPVVLATEGVRFQWIMDASRETAESVAQEFGIGPVVDEIPPATAPTDAVIITTPPHARPQLTRAAVEAGYHVLAEKPLGNSVADCKEQIDAAQEHAKVLACSHQYRFWPSRFEIKTWIEQQRLGPVAAISMSQGKPYSWVSKTGYTMLRDQVPGGVLINAGIHPLDTMLWWMGDPETIEYTDDALGGLESNFEMRLDFPGNVTGVLRQSRTTNINDEIRIVFRDGEITLPTYSRNEFSVIRGSHTETHSVASHDDTLYPAISQLQDFRDSIHEGRSPRVSGIEATRCVDVIEQCYRKKRQRPLPEVAPIPGKLW